MNNNLNKKIESYLFWKAEPVKFKELIQIFATNEEELKNELQNLQNRLSETGLSLKIDSEKVVLTTSPETSEIIEEITKQELNKELSRATLETLAIVVYRGPIKKTEIDYIRGVSSQFSLRNLMVRGLIEKELDPKDARSYVYKPSLELLNYLGLNTISELGEYVEVNKDIESFLSNQNNQSKEETPEEKNTENENGK